MTSQGKFAVVGTIWGGQKIKDWKRPDLVECEKVIVRCLLAANYDRADTRFGMLSPEECGALENLSR